jgi:hypothetical protein
VLVLELELVLEPGLGQELELALVLEPVRELELVQGPVQEPALGLHKRQTNRLLMPLPSPELISVFYSLFSSHNIGVNLS